MSKTVSRKVPMGKKRSPEEWMKLHQAYKECGLSREEFCRQNALSIHTFRDAVRRQQVEKSSFMEVKTDRQVMKTWALELELPSGIKLRMREV